MIMTPSEPDNFAVLRNGHALPWTAVPDLEMSDFRTALIDRVNTGNRLAALFAHRRNDRLMLIAIIADDLKGKLYLTSGTVNGHSYPALTPELPAAHAFEREIAEQWQITPEGHPWLKPMRFQPPLEAVSNSVFPHPPAAPGDADFFHMDGEQIHEVAVGPVHAGIIEPGHFRFQCFGEKIFHLEVALGYQHRGIERRLIGGPDALSLHYLETAAGDTTIGHATAYCQTIGALAGISAPPRAVAIRALMLELERMANHTGDLGAMAGDVAYLPTASYCGRLRGDYLNLTALICGNRFGRNIVRPGGVAFDLDAERIAAISARFTKAYKETENAINLLWNSASVMARFETTGKLDTAAARQLGVVGMVARSCGIEQDVRCDHPTGIFNYTQLPVSCSNGGDVLSRAQVRWLEMQRSHDFILAQLDSLPQTPLNVKVGRPRPDLVTVSLVEGWRGEICHVAITGGDGNLERYKVIDPSFHNWPAVAFALRNEEISNFPLCNKSFNLSYCGHDL